MALVGQNDFLYILDLTSGSCNHVFYGIGIEPAVVRL